MTNKLGFALVIASMALLGGCNTMNGAGKDMKSAGTAVSDASGKSNNK